MNKKRRREFKVISERKKTEKKQQKKQPKKPLSDDDGTNCGEDSEEAQIARTTETDDYLARVRSLSHDCAVS